MTTKISIRNDNNTENYLRASGEGRDGADGGDDGDSRELHFDYIFLILLKVMRIGRRKILRFVLLQLRSFPG